MKILNSYLRTANGKTQNNNISVTINEEENVSLISVEGFSKNKLDADFAAGIDIEIDGISEVFADCSVGIFWANACFSRDLGAVPDETQELVYKKNDGTFGVIIPVVSENYKCVLVGKSENVVTAKMFSCYENLCTCTGLSFVCAEGENPYDLLKKCFAAACKELGNKCVTIDKRRYPQVFEYLGWCSWDAMQIRVNEEDLLKKCDEFKEKNIPVNWVILDDMWGDVRDFYGAKYKTREEMFEVMHAAKLYSKEADLKRFPKGLKSCVVKIKEKGFKVGMWHPTTGYWMGIDPDGDLYKESKDLLIQTDSGRFVHDYKREKSYLYYNLIHDFFKECDVDFVKIDNQSMMSRLYKGLAPIGKAAREYHDGMEASVGQHFDNNVINCMGMSSEDMWNRSVSAISRCSSDFLPESAEWFKKNTVKCAYNSAVQGQLYYCDWDMWWSDDGQAVKNSVLKAVSGGPIYLSDEIGRSVRDVIMPLVLNDGRILRCNRPGMPTIDCITKNPAESKQIFKIQNICDESGVIAVFNFDKDGSEVKGTVSPSDVYGIDGDEFVLYEHFSKTYSMLKKDEKIDITLKTQDDYKLYVVVPVTNRFAPIGRVDKFISPKTIKTVINENIELYEDGEYAYVKDGKLHIVKKMD
ncbi:MAG: alpha-galactosidase [Firmicutes bacterium]|nr:alpha-galactosidase [Bacillota bacterium]